MLVFTNRIRIGTIGLLTLALSALANGAKAPNWLVPLLDESIDAAEEEEGAVILWDEAVYDYNEDGVMEMNVRWAVKVLNRTERDQAKLSINYEEGNSRVTNVKAWMIDPKGKIYKYNKSDMLDKASHLTSLHSKTMTKSLNLSEDVREGSVFAYEYTLRKDTVFSQIVWYLNQSAPVRNSIVSVIPPKGWEAKSVYLGGAKAVASRDGEAFVWKSSDLPSFEREKNGPPRGAIRPRLGIGLYPSNNDEKNQLEVFSSWKDIAEFQLRNSDPQIEPDQAIREKTKELCAGLSSDWERLSAIAEYAQSINYVSINVDLSLGEGYKPFQASEVFARHYGDCKDKTALTRSMLSCIGIESYAVAADIGYGAFVEPSWPTPHEFNHCIVAVPVGEDIDCDAVLEDPWLGRILLFDPTSDRTPFGKLPVDLPGSRVLIGSDRTEGLTEVPDLTPENNRVERTLALSVTELGAASGTMSEISIGNHALRERGYFRARSGSAYEEFLANWLSYAGSRATLADFHFEDNFEANRTELTTEFSLPAYGRSMRGKYLVFKPFQLNQIDPLEESLKERTQPFVFSPSSEFERLEITCPEGFSVDEYMSPVVIETDFARYKANVEEKEGKLSCTREIVFLDYTIPPERYHEVVAFYESVARTEQTPVLLIRNS